MYTNYARTIPMTRNARGVFVRDAGAFIVYPESVRTEAARVDAFMRSTDADATKAPPELASAWRAFYAAWRAFADSPDMQSAWGAGGRMDRVEEYARDLREWAMRLRASGVNLSAPQATVPTLDQPTFSEGTADTLKTLAKVAGVVAVVWLIHDFTK